MVEFVLGVIVGAAFAPFWMMVWGWIKLTPVYKKVVGLVTPKM